MKIQIVLSALCILSLSTFAQTEINDSNVEAKLLINNDRLILIDFYATWCKPCKVMEPIIKELEKEYSDRVDFYKMDVDKNDADDTLNVTAIPTYFFIKNSENLEVIEGAMTKSEMKALIEKHLDDSPSYSSSEVYDPKNNHGNSNEFDGLTVANLKSNATHLNNLAWHAFLEHDDIDSLIEALKIVKKSIAIEKDYYNMDTYASLLYKTGNYTQALKKAKEAIGIAKQQNEDYQTTSDLIDKIIDRM